MQSIYSAEYKAFLKRLRQQRLARGLTQVQVAKTMGKPQSFVSKIEKGERRIDPLKLKALAKLYGISVDRLLGHIRAAPNPLHLTRAAHLLEILPARIAFTRNHLLATTLEINRPFSEENGLGFGWLYRTRAETRILKLLDAKQSRISRCF